MKARVRDAGKIRILDLRGRITMGAGDLALREAVRGLIEDGHSRIVLNLKHVEWIDSAGLGEMVACKKRAVQSGGEVKILMPSEQVHNMMVLARIHEVFDIFHDELNAVGSF
ncbi:MAG: STAS domain-containing protein [Acidobacteriota bacterium]